MLSGVLASFVAPAVIRDRIAETAALAAHIITAALVVGLIPAIEWTLEHLISWVLSGWGHDTTISDWLKTSIEAASALAIFAVVAIELTAVTIKFYHFERGRPLPTRASQGGHDDTA